MEVWRYEWTGKTNLEGFLVVPSSSLREETPGLVVDARSIVDIDTVSVLREVI